jgi:TolB-like protein/DNA-binding winged helix-turn-helix (wHTH) protein/Flp pilus assembly protein TadD
MVGPQARSQLLRFGVFELDSQSGELRRNGVKVRLPDQPFQILQLLLDRPGELVTREQLRQQLWSSDTYVDFDLGLNSAIRRLREALDDSADNPRFVQTLPRRGYRFIAPVTPAGSHIEQPATEDSSAPDSRIRRKWIAGAVLLALTIAALAVISERGWWSRRRPGMQIRSLAVLPFDNLTGDASQEYLVDGITDGVTTNLAQLGGFDVISRTSAMRYKGANKPAAKQELRVDALLEGSVARTGRQVHITARLVHAVTDRHIWAQSYEGELGDVIQLQQQIADAIGGILGTERRSSRAGRAAAVRAVNPDAYEAYLKGAFEAARPSYEQYQIAIAHFEQAVAKQTDFVDAYVGIAIFQVQFLFLGPLSPHEAIPKAEKAARKAIELEETNAWAHQTLGMILHNYYWNWEDGDREFRRAREIKGGSAEGKAFGVAALIRSGRLEEAIEEAERARSLDPRSFDAYLNLGIAHRSMGHYERAVAEIRRALVLRPKSTRAPFQLGATLVLMGRPQDAIKEFETAVNSPPPRNTRFVAYLGYAYAAAGRTHEARRILEELEARARQHYVSSFGLALIYDALGEKGPALAAFERAYRDHAVEFVQAEQYPPFRTIAAEPQFVEIMRRIGPPR